MDWRDKILRRLHFCIGALLSIPLVMLGLTGSVLVYEPELTSWLDPVPPVSAAAPGQSLVAIIAAARAAAPEGWIPTMILPSDAATVPAEVRLSDPKRGPGPGGLQMYIDPVSLAVVGQHEPGANLIRRIFLLHANLMSTDRSGREIVGWFGVAMCTLGVTGLVLWWPARRRLGAALTVDTRARGPVLLRQIHGAAGIWGLVVFLLVSFTGVWLSFPQGFNATAASLLGTRDLRPGVAAIAVTPAAGVDALDVDGAVALAVAAAPDAKLRSVALPLKTSQPFRVALTRAGQTLPVVAFIDPWTKRVAELRDPKNYSVADRLVASVHAIHDGSWLGWPWRLLVFASGLLPALFAGSGIAMWLMKRRARRAPSRVRVYGVPGE